MQKAILIFSSCQSTTKYLSVSSDETIILQFLAFIYKGERSADLYYCSQGLRKSSFTHRVMFPSFHFPHLGNYVSILDPIYPSVSGTQSKLASQFHSLLKISDLAMAKHALVILQWDYCNVLYGGLPLKII